MSHPNSCSFCGKNDREVGMITGPTVYICYECVDLCVEIKKEGSQKAPFALIQRDNATAKVRAAMMGQKPTVGRIVHYTNLGDKDGKFPPETIAALITGINADGTVALKTFYRQGFFDMERVDFTAAPAGTEEARGFWTWPAKV